MVSDALNFSKDKGPGCSKFVASEGHEGVPLGNKEGRVCVCVCIYMYIDTYACMPACIYDVCMYLCVYVHTHNAPSSLDTVVTWLGALITLLLTNHGPPVGSATLCRCWSPVRSARTEPAAPGSPRR